MSILAVQKEKLIGLIHTALDQIIANGDLTIPKIPEINLEVPRDKAHGDFASNISLVLAKPAKQKPRDIAYLIVESLKDNEFIAKTEVAGPGFINFFLTEQWLYDTLRIIEQQDLDYGGDLTTGNNHRVLLEFVSANPVGPMNVVNARAAVIGDTLARLLTAVGYDVATEYYVNDVGVQTEVFGRSLLARYYQIDNPDYPFPDDGYPGQYITDLARKLKGLDIDLEAMHEAQRLEFCRTWGIDQMIDAQKHDLRALNVEFDRWFRENTLHKDNALEKMITELTKRDYMYKEDGALWFRSTAFGDDKDRVIVKQDGTYTYVTADIAYHNDKLQRGFSKLIDILGPDHHGYIGRMKAAVQALGYPQETLEILILQYVALLRDGRQIKMSKRAGEFITMKDLLDEVGCDAARYFFLMRSLESHLDFDLTLATQQNSENPVYYIQYAHARICSILKQVQARNIAVKNAEHAALENLTHELEIDLIKKMAELPDEIIIAANERAPHRIARYALDLASMFHSFYTHCRILGVQDQIRDARLVLINCVRVVLRRLLTLMGISAPESM